MAIATYCTVGFASIGFDELLTLWMATKRFRGYRDIDVLECGHFENDVVYFCLFLGGLGFSEKEIGIYQAVIAVVQTPLQIFFVHRVTGMQRESSTR